MADPESKIIRAYGLLNETVPKGMFYGIPYPGTFLLDSKGTVIAKYFEDDYTDRITVSDILTQRFGATVPAVSGAAHATVAEKHLTISASASTAVLRSGQRIALVLDVELKPGIHVYAPGVQGYIPIDLAIAQSPAATAHPGVYPPSKMFHLEAIQETVPVYTGAFRVLREVTIGKAVKPGDLTIEGTFRYQACDDVKCFLPTTIPVKWTFKVEPHDLERAPASIRHK